MKLTRLALTLAAVALGATALIAQPPKKPSTPAADSVKALKRDIRQQKVDERQAKAKGDTAKAHQLKKARKADKKALKLLKKEDATKTTKKTAPPKKP